MNVDASDLVDPAARAHIAPEAEESRALAPAGEAEQRARGLLSAVSLTWAVLSATSGMVSFFAAPAPIGLVVARTMLCATIGHLAARWLSRRRLAAAVALEVATQVIATTSIQLAVGAFNENTGLAMACWYGMALLTAAAFLRPRAIAATGAVLATLLVLVMVGIGGAGPEVMHPLTLFTVLAALTITVRRHRDTLETIHHRELQARNSELEILRGGLEQRVLERTRELGAKNDELVEAYETLQKNQRALLSSEKMAAVGRLTAGIAHEMASPLAAVMCAIEDLGTLVDEYRQSIGDRDVSDEDHQAIAAEMDAARGLAASGAERAAGYVRSVRAQTRDDGTRSAESFDATAIARDAIALVGHAARAAHCTITLDAPEERVALIGPPSRLAQVLTNLLQNAIDAQGEAGGGDVLMAVRRVERDVVIEVVDRGAGIAPEVLPHVFEPLFTTKPYGKGTGLGLAVAKEAVEGDFGGGIEVESELGAGTRMRVRLPRATGGEHGA